MSKKKVLSPYGQAKPLYTFEQLKEVWYFSMLQGASLWQYSIDKKRKLPSDFEKGLNSIRESLTDPEALQFLLGTNIVIFGLYDEAIDKDQPVLSTSQTTKNKRKQNPPNSEKVK